MRSLPTISLKLWILILLLAVLVPLGWLTKTGQDLAVGAALPFLQLKQVAGSFLTTWRNRWQPLEKSEKARLLHLERLVQQLQLQLQNSKNATAENREFRMYYELAAPPDWKLVVAPVIARDPVSWNRRFRIGKGSQSGILPGAAVMAGNQVIGRVAEVTPRSALVYTVADPTCRLSVRLPATNAVGLLSGRMEQKWHEPAICLITFLPRDYPYTDEDFVVTSGLGGTVPAGLPVGRIIPWPDGKTAKTVNAAYTQLLLRPSADFTVFNFVAVVIPRGAWPKTSSMAAAEDN